MNGDNYDISRLDRPNSADSARPSVESPVWNLIFNIALPVFILNKGSQSLGPVWALVLALVFPIAYGTNDLWKRRKFNFFSLLGVVNVTMTGGLALSGLGGIWFSIKEAAFPLLIGVFVAASAVSRKPFMQTLLINPQTIHWDRVDGKLKELGREEDFLRLLRRSTWLLAGSFLLSALANFVLAERIFLPIDDKLAEAERAAQLNHQIAEMTSMGFAITFVPSLLILAGILYYLFRGLTRTTGLSLDQIMR